MDHNEVTPLAQAVVRLVRMNEAKRRDMGRRARETSTEGYTWDQIARRPLVIYRQATTPQS